MPCNVYKIVANCPRMRKVPLWAVCKAIVGLRGAAGSSGLPGAGAGRLASGERRRQRGEEMTKTLRARG